MSFDGNGTFQLPSPAYPFIAGTTISAESMNEILSEIAQALGLLLRHDGENRPTGNISWGGYKISQLAAGTAEGDAVNYAQVFIRPTFIEASAQASPPVGDSSLKYATTEWVKSIALNTALPGQSLPKAGFVLTTNGQTADWAPLDGRGIKHAPKGNSSPGGAPVTVVLSYLEAEAHYMKITGPTTVVFSDWPKERAAVRLLTVENAGAFQFTLSGVVYFDANGAETTDFSKTGITWQVAGRDRIIVCSEPGLGVWVKVIR